MNMISFLIAIGLCFLLELVIPYPLGLGTDLIIGAGVVLAIQATAYYTKYRTIRELENTLSNWVNAEKKRIQESNGTKDN